MERTLIFNTTITIPEVPEEFEGKEPTFNELVEFVNVYYKEGSRPRVIEEYEKTILSTWATGKYYLLGLVLTAPTDRITTERLENAIQINHQRSIDYGVPCNSFEYGSIVHTERMFADLLQIIEKYYVVMMEIEYMPGGARYQAGLKRFNERNGII